MHSYSDFSLEEWAAVPRLSRYVDNNWKNWKEISIWISLSEREENVKADIFAAYITLLRQTRPVASQTLDADAMEDDSG